MKKDNKDQATTDFDPTAELDSSNTEEYKPEPKKNQTPPSSPRQPQAKTEATAPPLSEMPKDPNKRPAEAEVELEVTSKKRKTLKERRAEAETELNRVFGKDKKQVQPLSMSVTTKQDPESPAPQLPMDERKAKFVQAVQDGKKMVGSVATYDVKWDANNPNKCTVYRSLKKATGSTSEPEAKALFTAELKDNGAVYSGDAKAIFNTILGGDKPVSVDFSDQPDQERFEALQVIKSNMNLYSKLNITESTWKNFDSPDMQKLVDDIKNDYDVQRKEVAQQENTTRGPSPMR